ncbi:MAG: hypothetical protein ACFHWX_07490 [Bacteroidota bacterium]
MIYNKIFKQKERNELIDLLSERKKLNYNAKSALLDIINADEYFTSNFSEALDELKADVEKEESSITSFDYLKYLGFRISKEGDTIKVTRLSRFYLVDLIGVLIGALLSGIIYFGIPSWNMLLSEGISTVPIVISVLTTVIALIGLILLVKSLSRYIEYSGFEIVKNASGLMIKKRNDILIESVLVKESSLDLEESEKGLAMVYHDEQGKSINIIQTKGGVHVRKTLIQLKNLLSNS